MAALAIGFAGCGRSDDSRTIGAGQAEKANTNRDQPRVTRLDARGGEALILDAVNPSPRPKTRLSVKVPGTVTRIRANPLERQALARGQSYVGIRLVIKNVGRYSWTGAPGDMSALVDDDDEQADRGGAADNCGGAFAQHVELHPGSTQRGCVLFRIRRGHKAALFQFNPDYPATPAAQWHLIPAGT